MDNGRVLFRTNSITETSTSDLEGVGVLRWVDDKCYRWVLNGESSTALTVGQTCYHDPADADEQEENVYLLGTGTTVASMMAGVVQATSLAAGSYGWILVLGNYGSVSMYANGVTAIAVGDYLKGSSGQGYVVHDSSSSDVSQTQVSVTVSIGGTTNLTTLPTLTNIATVTSTLGTETLTMLTILDTSTVDGAASIAGNFRGLFNQIYTQRVFNANVINILTTMGTLLNAIYADVGGLVTSQRQGRGIIAMEALASSVTIATAKRGFVRCL